MTTSAAPDPGHDLPDEVWILADDPEDEAFGWPEDPGSGDRSHRS